MAGDPGVDVVVDMVGGELLEPCVRSLNWSGRAVVVGFASGSIPKVFTYLLTHFLLVCSRTYLLNYVLTRFLDYSLTDLLTYRGRSQPTPRQERVTLWPLLGYAHICIALDLALVLSLSLSLSLAQPLPHPQP